MTNREYLQTCDTVKRYTKRPVTVEAVKWTGDNMLDILKFTAFNTNVITTNSKKLMIKTLEGTMTASEGDYIIKGVNGEIYPCKPDIFKKTYIEEVYE